MYTIRFAWFLKKSNIIRLSKKFYRVWLKTSYLPQSEKKKNFVSNWKFFATTVGQDQEWNKSTFAPTHIWFHPIEVLVCCYYHKRDSLLTFSFVLYFLSLFACFYELCIHIEIQWYGHSKIPNNCISSYKYLCVYGPISHSYWGHPAGFWCML